MTNSECGVSGHSTWICKTPDRQLSDVLLSVPITKSTNELNQAARDSEEGCVQVVLEQADDGSPCVLSLHCGPQAGALIGSLLVVSEARTMEVYSQAGEYCGTCRGEREDTAQPHSEDRGPLYWKRLPLDCPAASCQVKLLSLGGRSSVLVSRVAVGLQALEQPSGGCLGNGSIDMQHVQRLVEEMGTTLSPGAQSLMDLVHQQQQNQSSVLSGLLPALMGSGTLSALSGVSRPLAINGPLPSTTRSPVLNSMINGSSVSTPPVLAQNGALTSDECDSPPSPGSNPSLPAQTFRNRSPANSDHPVDNTQLEEMMSYFLNGKSPEQRNSPALSSAQDLLPMLQTVCGQVTQLRLESAAREAEKKITNGAWELDQAMDRRLEEMELRLKEHIDRRLDVLEQRLEKVLLSALPLLAREAPKAPISGPPPEPTLTPEAPALH